MKSKYALRKNWEEIARQMGMEDKQHHVYVTDPSTKKDSKQLINNFRRFVKGMLDLPLNEQYAKLALFESKMEAIKAEVAKEKLEAKDSFKIDLPEPEAPVVLDVPEVKPDNVI